MKTDGFTKKGAMHTDHNEDAFYMKQISDRWFIAAVMDGCSSGVDSHFASALYAKIIRKVCKTLPQIELMQVSSGVGEFSVQTIGELILSQLYEESKSMQKIFMAEVIEMLSTVILAVYNMERKELWINSSGDGLFEVNGNITVIDQNNMPDFMAYHYKSSYQEWINNHTQTHEFNNVESFSISTDGVQKFFKPKSKEFEVVDMKERVLGTNVMLSELLEQLKEKEYLVPFDDFTVVNVSNP